MLVCGGLSFLQKMGFQAATQVLDAGANAELQGKHREFRCPTLDL